SIKMLQSQFAVLQIIVTIFSLITRSIISLGQPPRILAVALFLMFPELPQAQTRATTTAFTGSTTAALDPGVREGAAGAGGPIAGLTARQKEFFAAGQEDFEEVEIVADGLGPRMNLDSCAGCHAQPATGGSSPRVNPQVAFATKDGGTDRVPWFITVDG